MFHAPRFDEQGKVIDRAASRCFHNGVLIQNNVESTASRTTIVRRFTSRMTPAADSPAGSREHCALQEYLDQRLSPAPRRPLPVRLPAAGWTTRRSPRAEREYRRRGEMPPPHVHARFRSAEASEERVMIGGANDGATRTASPPLPEARPAHPGHPVRMKAVHRGHHECCEKTSCRAARTSSSSRLPIRNPRSYRAGNDPNDSRTSITDAWNVVASQRLSRRHHDSTAANEA